MDKITFLGTGGGRVVLSTQMRSTGGFVVNLDGKQIHIDPGPGALLRCRECGIFPRRTDIIWVSHHHTDHAHDINALVDALTLGGVHKKGVLISTKEAIEGTDEDNPQIHPFLKKALVACHVIKSGESVKEGNINLKAVKAEHDCNNNGLIIETEKTRIGYTSDTKYFEGLGQQYVGCDVLICNVLRPGNGGWQSHLCSGDAAKVFQQAKPKLGIITAFGAKMIKANPMYEAREIQRQSGVQVIVARDGLVVQLKDV